MESFEVLDNIDIVLNRLSKETNVEFSIESLFRSGRLFIFTSEEDRDEIIRVLNKLDIKFLN
jgi:hypothetical protein